MQTSFGRVCKQTQCSSLYHMFSSRLWPAVVDMNHVFQTHAHAAVCQSQHQLVLFWLAHIRAADVHASIICMDACMCAGGVWFLPLHLLMPCPCRLMSCMDLCCFCCHAQSVSLQHTWRKNVSCCTSTPSSSCRRSNQSTSVLNHQVLPAPCCTSSRGAEPGTCCQLFVVIFLARMHHTPLPPAVFVVCVGGQQQHQQGVVCARCSMCCCVLAAQFVAQVELGCVVCCCSMCDLWASRGTVVRRLIQTAQVDMPSGEGSHTVATVACKVGLSTSAVHFKHFNCPCGLVVAMFVRLVAEFARGCSSTYWATTARLFTRVEAGSAGMCCVSARCDCLPWPRAPVAVVAKQCAAASLLSCAAVCTACFL